MAHLEVLRRASNFTPMSGTVGISFTQADARAALDLPASFVHARMAFITSWMHIDMFISQAHGVPIAIGH